ncbi:hypothetical protein [Burkholderia ubonensis]|uniref:hypothetical protein n=1 Tax=Burkholderia ubonensis TaxID=101571 RepID=UPI003F751169
MALEIRHLANRRTLLQMARRRTEDHALPADGSMREHAGKELDAADPRRDVDAFLDRIDEAVGERRMQCSAAPRCAGCRAAGGHQGGEERGHQERQHRESGERAAPADRIRVGGGEDEHDRDERALALDVRQGCGQERAEQHHREREERDALPGG